MLNRIGPKQGTKEKRSNVFDITVHNTLYNYLKINRTRYMAPDSSKIKEVQIVIFC
jgi:hypothetical protein